MGGWQQGPNGSQMSGGMQQQGGGWGQGSEWGGERDGSFEQTVPNRGGVSNSGGVPNRGGGQQGGGVPKRGGGQQGGGAAAPGMNQGAPILDNKGKNNFILLIRYHKKHLRFALWCTNISVIKLEKRFRQPAV